MVVSLAAGIGTAANSLPSTAADSTRSIRRFPVGKKVRTLAMLTHVLAETETVVR